MTDDEASSLNYMRERLEEVQRQASTLKHKILREAGWKLTSNVPGNYYLWEKDYTIDGITSKIRVVDELAYTITIKEVDEQLASEDWT